MALEVVFIGSGNVAWHLARAMDLAGHYVSQVISRHEENAKELASKVGARFNDDLSRINTNADVCLICVPDDQIEEVVRGLPRLNSGLVHTCGPKAMDILDPKSKQIGVFYPLQSFSKNKPVDMLEVPILLESSENEFYYKLYKLADSISNKVLHVITEDRLKYHLAAVFANNFTNHLLYLAEKYLKSNELDFSVLHPLIIETSADIKGLSPHDLQTGPAKRGDMKTINKHLELLSGNDDLIQLYKLLTEGIQSQE